MALNKFVDEAKELFRSEETAWSEIYRKALQDMKFLSDEEGAQWDDKDFSRRRRTGRPAITVDQLDQFVRQVVNDARMNTPSIKAIPVGGGADLETAEVIQGLVRHIQYKSKADSVYDTAISNSTRCSIGWIIVDHKIVDPATNAQELCLKRVVDPLTVWVDSASVEVDGSDARHGFYLKEISKTEFKRLYPGFEPVCFREKDSTFSLFRKDDRKTVWIAEYFVAEGDDYNRTIKRYTLSGRDVLEETLFPGKYIPIVPVYGYEMWIAGKRTLLSLIRKSKQAQQLYNYLKSVEIEALQKQPLAPIMAAVGQTEDFADEWSDPARAVVLRYRQEDVKGNPAPAPQRLMPPQLATGLVNASALAVDDIKATMGLYNASIGARSNETSGKAIMARQQEGDVATYHFGDNLVKAITQVGCILLSAIPFVYDSARILQIIGNEDEVKPVGVNGEIAQGQDRTFDLTRGEYMVRITTEAPYTTKRQESAEFFTEIVTRQPELMNVAGDLLFKYMDFPGAQALSNRMKKLIDPKLLDDEGDDNVQAQIEMAMQQSQAIIDQLQAQIAELSVKAEGKQQELQLKVVEAETNAQSEQLKFALEQEKLNLDKYKIDLEAALKQEELRLKALELTIKQQEAENREIEREMDDLANEIADDLQSPADMGGEILTPEENYG